MDGRISERDRTEIVRSAKEAKRVGIQPVHRAEVERYLSPPSNTPYPLEYAFHLLGEVQGKTVLDLGCGTGENIIPLVARGARVVGIDISPDLIALAQERLNESGLAATLMIGSAYQTGLPDQSVDVIFCIALIHHLDIGLVRDEMRRILARNGRIILKEPIRFSKGYARLRSLLPSKGDVSEYEHPLTREEVATISEPFKVEGTCYFRLPGVPLLAWLFASNPNLLWRIDRWMLRRCPVLRRYATAIVMRLLN